MRALSPLALLLALVFASGCNPVYLEDDIEFFLFDFRLFPSLRQDDRLQTPYVEGAQVRLSARGVDEDDRVGWQIVSHDSTVLRVDSTEDGRAEVTATGPGRALVRIDDDEGNSRNESEIEVRRPTHLELRAHGPLIVERLELLPEDDSTVRIVEGGMATFEVIYFDGDVRLNGSGALDAVAPEGVFATPRRTFLDRQREWLSLEGDVIGTYEVELRAGAHPVRTITVEVVPAESVAFIQLHGMNESDASEGDSLTVLAQASDADGEPIYGIEAEWDLDGRPIPGVGDLFRYSFVSGAFAELEAHYGDHHESVRIQATGGLVDSTNNLGCSAGGNGEPFAPWLALTLGAWLVTRRRRKAR